MTAKPTMGLWTSKWTRQIWWPSCDSKFLATLLAVTILSNAVVASALDPIGSGSGIHRRTRQADGGEPEATAEPEGETESEPEPTKSPIGLSEILVRKSHANSKDVLVDGCAKSLAMKWFFLFDAHSYSLLGHF